MKSAYFYQMVIQGIKNWRKRELVVWVILLCAIILLGWLSLNLLIPKFSVPSGDFVEYWTAGQLLLRSDNPYDPGALLILQQAIGRDMPQPLIMYNPPWVLPLIIPFALLPYSISRLLWLAFHALVLLFCVSWLWRLYYGVWDNVWISWILMVTFLPTFSLLLPGQIGAFILLGLVLFLYCEKHRLWAFAGAVTLFVAVKPQVLYLFWFALILWCLRYKKWSLLAGMTGAFFVASITPLILNIRIFEQYLHLLRNYPPVEWLTPTLGAMLRLLLGAERFGLQFIPVVLGAIWLAYRWYNRGENWNWASELPGLVLISIITSPYAWTHDYVVLILVIIQLFAILLSARHRILSRFLVSYILVNGLAWVLRIFYAPGVAWFVWLPMALGMLYYWVICRSRVYSSAINHP